MIHDRTEHFLKIRQTPSRGYSPLTISPVTRLLEALDTSIQQLENRMEMFTLPNFGSREKKHREIADLKERIQHMAKEIEAGARAFVCAEHAVQEAVQLHIFGQLQLQLTKFKRLEQMQLYSPPAKVSDGGFCCTQLEGHGTEGAVALETLERANNIKTCIYNVTSTLIQLKMALKAQTGLIDTIDSCFEKSNMYLERANDEIERLPGRYCGFKDYIIYVLLYVICVLLVLIFVKNYKGRITWIDHPSLIFKKGSGGMI